LFFPYSQELTYLDGLIYSKLQYAKHK